MAKENTTQKIIELLCSKASFKQKLYYKARQWMGEWKKAGEEIIKDVEPSVTTEDERVNVTYEDRNELECLLKVGTDAILLNMHSNVFAFPAQHAVWQMDYVKQKPERGYFAVFHLYNFLNDSVKYNRLRDQGILLCRIFVNVEGHFFVEGKKELTEQFGQLGTRPLTPKIMRDILQTVIVLAVDADLTVPDYQEVMWVTIDQLNAKDLEVRLQTSKKIGYLQ